MSRIVAVDTETTGLVPASRYPIFEVAIVVVDDGKTIGEQSWWMPVDLADADPGALRLNRFYEREPGEDKKTPRSTVAKEVARWTANATLVGCNVSFDAERLDLFLRSEGYAPAWHYRLYEVESAASAKLGVEPPWPSSNGLAAELGVVMPEEDRHTALGDARFALAIYQAVFNGKTPKAKRTAKEKDVPDAVLPETVAEVPAPAQEDAADDVVEEPGRTISRGVPKGMPAEGDAPRCEECQMVIADPNSAPDVYAKALEKARISWSVRRRVLCPEHFSASKIR